MTFGGIESRPSRWSTNSLFVLAGLYTLLLVVMLLQPFDLHFPFGSTGVTWTPDGNGIQISDVAGVRSLSPATKLYETMTSGTGMTLEGWIATHDPMQGGPARIVSFSQDPFNRNFTLGQQNHALVMRLRTTQTNENGAPFELVVKNVFGSHAPQHIVFTYDYGTERVYVDGDERSVFRGLKGGFSTWDPTYPLVLANEATANRPWFGELFLVAIYSRALSRLEIVDHYILGQNTQPETVLAQNGARDGLVSLYTFTEGKGVQVTDHSDAFPALHLKFFQSVNMREFLTLPFSKRKGRCSSRCIRDILVNIVIFIPLGFFVYVAFARHFGDSIGLAIVVCGLGFLFSFAAETLQYFSLSRFSSMTDLINNGLGTALGIAMSRTSLARSLLQYRNAS